MPSFTANSFGVLGNTKYTSRSGRTAALPGSLFQTPDGSGPVPPVAPERVAQPWRQPDTVAGRQVSLDMGRSPHSRDGGRHGRVLENEPERKLGQVHSLRDQRFEAFDPCEGLRTSFRREVGVAPVAFRPG